MAEAGVRRSIWPTFVTVALCLCVLLVVAPLLVLLAVVPAAVGAWVIGARRAIRWALTVAAILVLVTLGAGWAVGSSGSGSPGPTPPPPSQAG